MTPNSHSDNNEPIIYGTGLIALDVIIDNLDGSEPLIMAGGSCGNVLSILPMLGWKSIPLANLGADETAEIIIEEMKKNGVDTSFIHRSETRETPIIIEKIYKNKNGEPRHKFLFRCPDCKRVFPRFKPLLGSYSTSIIPKLGNAEVFYTDRLTNASMFLAKHFKKIGAIVFLELTKVPKEELINGLNDYVDVLKYSSEQLGAEKYLLKKSHVPLIIETQGEKGVVFWFKTRETTEYSCHKVLPCQMPYIIDTAGAGDWCSAGIISKLGRDGRKKFDKLDSNSLTEAINFGQYLAAINCMFKGARGSMETIKNVDIKKSFLESQNTKCKTKR